MYDKYWKTKLDCADLLSANTLNLSIAVLRWEMSVFPIGESHLFIWYDDFIMSCYFNEFIAVLLQCRLIIYTETCG